MKPSKNAYKSVFHFQTQPYCICECEHREACLETGICTSWIKHPANHGPDKGQAGGGFVMCHLHSKNSFKSSICPKTTDRDQTGWQLAQRCCLGDDQPTPLRAHRLGNPLLCSLLQQHFCFVPPCLENPPLSTLNGAWFVYSNHFVKEKNPKKKKKPWAGAGTREADSPSHATTALGGNTLLSCWGIL